MTVLSHLYRWSRCVDQLGTTSTLLSRINWVEMNEHFVRTRLRRGRLRRCTLEARALHVSAGESSRVTKDRLVGP